MIPGWCPTRPPDAWVFSFLGHDTRRDGKIYPRWVEAHGAMIVTPVHWYQVPGAELEEPQPK